MYVVYLKLLCGIIIIPNTAVFVITSIYITNTVCASIIEYRSYVVNLKLEINLLAHGIEYILYPSKITLCQSIRSIV